MKERIEITTVQTMQNSIITDTDTLRANKVLATSIYVSEKPIRFNITYVDSKGSKLPLAIYLNPTITENQANYFIVYEEGLLVGNELGLIPEGILKKLITSIVPQMLRVLLLHSYPNFEEAKDTMHLNMLLKSNTFITHDFDLSIIELEQLLNLYKEKIIKKWGYKYVGLAIQTNTSFIIPNTKSTKYHSMYSKLIKNKSNSSLLWYYAVNNNFDSKSKILFGDFILNSESSLRYFKDLSTTEIQTILDILNSKYSISTKLFADYLLILNNILKLYCAEILQFMYKDRNFYKELYYSNPTNIKEDFSESKLNEVIKIDNYLKNLENTTIKVLNLNPEQLSKLSIPLYDFIFVENDSTPYLGVNILNCQNKLYNSTYTKVTDLAIYEDYLAKLNNIIDSVC